MVALLFLLTAAVLGSRAEVISFSVSSGETLRNVLLTSSGSLILGSNLTLRRLNGDLEVLQRTDDLPSDQVNRLLSGDPGGTYSDSFMSCTRTQCELLDVDDIESRRWAAAVLLDGTFNAHGLFVTGPDGFSVFTAAMRNEQQVSRIQRGNLTGVNGDSQSFVGYARQSELDRFRSRAFLFVFEREGFSYYIHHIFNVFNGGENREEIRVVRLCNNDTSNDMIFTSYFEIKLKCIAMGVTEQPSPTAATFIPFPNSFGVDSIIISVVDSFDSENDVCVYSLPEIHSLMTAKYDECRSGTGMAGLERDGQLHCWPFTPTQLQDPIINECNLVSTLLPAQEVASPLTAEPAFSQSLTSGQFSSLLHSMVGGFNFIFASTVSGKLHQYYVESSSSILLIHTFDLVESSEVGVANNITQLTVSSDDLTLYALTLHKLISHSIDVCDSYESCATCVGGGDPLCGWCCLKSRCTREVDCAESAEWVYEDMGSCPMILSADPNIIYTDQLQSGLSVVLETANIPDGGRMYLCIVHVFMNNAPGQHTSSSTITMETSSSVATRIDERFTCDVPTTIPPIPNMEDALLSSLSLRHGGNNIATLSSPIRFADCSVHTSCTECIQTESRCSWCPFTFKCIPRDGDCGDAETPVSTSCPKLLPHETTFDYLLHTNYLYGENPLVIRAENVAEFTDLFAEGKFKCVISESGRKLFTTGAVLGGDNEVHCQQRQFEYVYTDDEETLNATLDVVWTTNNLAIDNPSGTGITLYSCPRLGSNCARCLTVSPDYQCSYCFTQSMFSCSLDTLCSGASQTVSDVAECDFPVIDSISPTSGPIEGGTMVTVVGTNLGATRSNIESVQIDGVSCDIVDQLYQPGISITCVTEGVASSGSYPINIQFDYLSSAVISNAMFTFKTPEANSVTPVRGPQSGGTMVTISGRDLDIGSSQSVRLADRNCSDVTVSSDGMELTCISSEFPELLDKAVSNVTVTIDNKNIVISGHTYEYVADPEVTEIQPHISFAAGGTEYIISGSNLHVVQEPRLLVHIGGARRRRRQAQQTFRSEPCKPDQLGMTMSCMAPEISLSSQQSATIGVEMDGVTSLLRLALMVDVHPNPRFRTFNDRSFSNNEEIRLTVESEGSAFVFMETMVRVLLTPCGRDLCPCVEITFLDSNTSFTCIVESTSGLSTDRDLTVTAMVGDYSQNVGRIKITLDVVPLDVVVIVASIAGLFVIGMVVFVIVVFAFCYRTRQKKQHASVGMAQRELTPHTCTPRNQLQLHSIVPKAVEIAQEELQQLPQRLHIPSNQIRLLNPIGHGEFGEVYKARLIKWHGEEMTRTVAVKTLRGLFTPNDVQQILQEVVKMQDFSHPHVMSLIGVCLDSGVGVVMPYMANGSILSYLKKERGILLLSEDAELEEIPARKLLTRLCLQIAKGMEYLAQQMFVHRDLAARNCMLDHRGDVKVGDFGLAEDMYATGYVREESTVLKVPYKWMPPESLEDGLFSEKSDVWSYGVTCWEVFTVGKTPYPALDPPTLLRMLKEGHRLECPDNLACSPEMYVLMKKCWKLPPADRPCFSDLVATLDKSLSSVAGYTELSMTLLEPSRSGESEEWPQYEEIQPPDIEPTEAEIAVEPNPVYGLETVGADGHPVPFS